MIMSSIFNIFILFLTISFSTMAFAQDTENTDDYDSSDTQFSYDLPSDFSGTLTDEDEDNVDLKKEADLFGANEAEVDEDGNDILDDDFVDEEEATHTLKLEFEGEVTFYDRSTGEPFMEVSYTTTLEQDIVVKGSRYRSEGSAEFKTDIIGNLAGNELFTCKAEIDIEDHKFYIMSKLNTIPETDELPETKNLAIQLKMDSGYQELWTSNCLGIDGSELNTTGDYESYNKTLLENISPNLVGVEFEDFIEGDPVEEELEVEFFEIDDEAADQIISFTGKGTLSVEPL